MRVIADHVYCDPAQGDPGKPQQTRRHIFADFVLDLR